MREGCKFACPAGTTLKLNTNFLFGVTPRPTQDKSKKTSDTLLCVRNPGTTQRHTPAPTAGKHRQAHLAPPSPERCPVLAAAGVSPPGSAFSLSFSGVSAMSELAMKMPESWRTMATPSILEGETWRLVGPTTIVPLFPGSPEVIANNNFGCLCNSAETLPRNQRLSPHGEGRRPTSQYSSRCSVNLFFLGGWNLSSARSWLVGVALSRSCR